MPNFSSRGFASMDAIRQREIASKGGKAAHVQGRAHEWSPAEAREAGRKGGEKRLLGLRQTIIIQPQEGQSLPAGSNLDQAYGPGPVVEGTNSDGSIANASNNTAPVG